MPPVPIEKEKSLPMPPVSAALGMALAYYGYPFFISVSGGPFIILGIFLFFVIVVSLLRVFRLGRKDVPVRFHKVGILAVAAAVGFSLGIASRRTVPGPVETGLPAESVIAVSGILREDPRSLQSGSGLGVLKLRECSGSGGLRATARGSLTVFFPAESIPRLKEFGRGCEIYIDGMFVQSQRGSLFRASSVHVVKAAPALDTFRTGLRTALLEKFQSREGRIVWGGLASALLLGMRDDLEVDLSAEFRNSGCAHILALSGMHLAIISGILAFLISRPLGIRRASLAGAFFILFYVFIAGSQPSLVRSAIMYLITTIALWGFLKIKAISLLSMAFILQLIFQTETGISLSFILSYLALAGMLTLGTSIRSLFRGRLPEIINGSLSASLGAFIFTSPVVVFYFGSLKPIGILAGLLVAPLSSVFMVFALMALTASFLPIPLWNLLDFVLTLIYRLIEFLVSLAGKVPGFSFLNPLPVLIISVLLSFLVLFIRKQDLLYRKSVGSFD